MTQGPVEVRGAEQLAAIAKQLKDTGEKDLRRAFLASITKSTEPLRRRDLPASARRTLPRRGGLGDLVAKSKMRQTRRLTGRAVGLRVAAVNPNLQLRKLDEGQVRHPVFARPGRARVWVRQPVTPGWFTKPAEAAAPQIRADVERAMQDVANKIGARP